MSGYNIYQSDGTPVSIPANAIDTTLYNPTGGGGLGGSGTPAGIQFIGQNAVDYGAPIAQNFLQLTENFCSNVVPGNAFALQGQLWFNQAGATSGTLFVRATVNGSSSPVTAPAAVGSSPQAGWYQIVTDDGDGDVTITGTMTAGSFSGTLSGTASALAGGTAGQVPYQSAPGVTLFAGPGTSGQVLVSNGISGPSFEDTSTFLSLYLPLAGGTMTGNLILNGAPTTNLQAATKQYVDDNISGLQWQPAISAVDLINDSLSTPPGSPVTGQTYIINTAPTGAWTAIGAGHAVIWNGSAWIDLFGVVVPVGTWFGINLEHGGTPGGSFTGYSNALVYVTGNTPGSFTYTFNTPSTSSWAVTDTNDSDPVDFGDSYNWNTTSLAWVQFNTGVNYTAGTGISISAGKISNTGVTSLAAGSGVHISASTGAVTVSNSGVVSFNGRSGSVSLTSGDVATAQGLTAGGVFVGNGTNTGTNIGAGSAGFVLTSNGASTPSWQAVSGAQGRFSVWNCPSGMYTGIVNYSNTNAVVGCSYSGGTASLTVPGGQTQVWVLMATVAYITTALSVSHNTYISMELDGTAVAQCGASVDPNVGGEVPLTVSAIVTIGAGSHSFRVHTTTAQNMYTSGSGSFCGFRIV